MSYNTKKLTHHKQVTKILDSSLVLYLHLHQRHDAKWWMRIMTSVGFNWGLFQSRSKYLVVRKINSLQLNDNFNVSVSVTQFYYDAICGESSCRCLIGKTAEFEDITKLNYMQHIQMSCIILIKTCSHLGMKGLKAAPRETQTEWWVQNLFIQDIWPTRGAASQLLAVIVIINHLISTVWKKCCNQSVLNFLLKHFWIKPFVIQRKLWLVLIWWSLWPQSWPATLQTWHLETATGKTAETSVWTVNPVHHRTRSSIIPVSLMKTHNNQALLSREKRKEKGRLEPGLGCWGKKTKLGGKPVKNSSSMLMTTKWNIQWR